MTQTVFKAKHLNGEFTLRGRLRSIVADKGVIKCHHLTLADANAAP